ncbi:MAG TPA: FtsX-like permease family protein [Streptosporangiaceae bacterium]|nr:FtsX-like permease family protein [Streptosporangiaceae bacterium]
MIRFGLRLTLRGGREAVVRLAITAIAVAFGTGLLLAAIAGVNAVNTQNLRVAWLDTVPGPVAGHQAPAAARAQPLWWELRPDYYRGELMGRLDVAATGPRSPVPPGIPRLPGPGQYYASPAMTKLLDTVPADELADRYPGHQIGTIADSALPAPNSLLIIVGHSVSYMAHQRAADKVSAIQAVPLSSCDGPSCAIAVGIDANGMDLILSVVGVGLLLPVLIFIGASTRLSAARREQRFAAMRLTGATPRQVTVIASVESAVAGALGTAAGFALFFALRPVIASFPYSGAPFFTSDMSLSLTDIAVVVVGVPAAAAIIAWIALRRVQTSPLVRTGYGLSTVVDGAHPGGEFSFRRRSALHRTPHPHLTPHPHAPRTRTAPTPRNRPHSPLPTPHSLPAPRAALSFP